MQIKCPKCGNVCKSREEPSIGQHLQCPYCSEIFPYSGGNQPSVDQQSQPDGAGDAPKMTECACPHCGTVYEVEEEKVGAAEKCDVCGEVFVVEKREEDRSSEGPHVAIPQEVKATSPKRDDELGQESSTAQAVKPRLKFVPKVKARRPAMSVRPKKKFCRECGNELNPKAAICPKCGVPVARNDSSRGAASYVDVPDYLVGAIVALILFLPLGIFAIVFALQSRQKLANGDCRGAEADSRTAGILVKIAIALGIIGVVTWIIIGYIAEKESQRTYEVIRSLDEEYQREMQKANEAAERLIRRLDYYY